MRDYKRENKYKAQPEQVKFREERNKARKIMQDQGKVHKGDGLQVDHIVPLSKGGKTVPSNLRVVPAGVNDSFKRDSKHRLVNQTSKRERRGGNS
jgi:5-methylcytosine-specific restriction endonuclease McrA